MDESYRKQLMLIRMVVPSLSDMVQESHVADCDASKKNFKLFINQATQCRPINRKNT